MDHQDKRVRLVGLLCITAALAVAGCGSSTDAGAGSGGAGGMGGFGGQGGQGGVGGVPGVCFDAPASTPCGDDGEVCDGRGQCVTCAEGEDCFSDGSDGAFFADEDVELPSGVYNFTTFAIQPGVTVKVTGSDPLIITTQRSVTIQGTLSADSGHGTDGVPGEAQGVGGAGVAGGYDGGDGSFDTDAGSSAGSPGLGPGAGGGGTDLGPGAGASYGSQGGNAALGDAVAGHIYGDALLTTLWAGSSAGGGSGGLLCAGGGGGAGGGIIKFSVLGSLRLGTNAVISANGGNGGTDGDASCGGGGGGAGGTVWVQAGELVNDGMISARGGVGVGGLSNINPAGGSGRIRIDTNTPDAEGTVLPPSGANGGPWYVPAE